MYNKYETKELYKKIQKVLKEINKETIGMSSFKANKRGTHPSRHIDLFDRISFDHHPKDKEFKEAMLIASRRNTTKLAYLAAIDDIRQELGL